MTRFLLSSCGVVAELTHITQSEEAALVGLAAVSLSLTLQVWSHDLLMFADRLMGNHLPANAMLLIDAEN